MEQNIFKNAKFGDKYRTRDGRKAIFLQFDTIVDEDGKDIGNLAYVYTIQDGEYCVNMYGYDADINVVPDTNMGYDIVGEWHEEINEEELDKLAHSLEVQQLLTVPWDDCYEECVECFKSGYRKAMEE